MLFVAFKVTLISIYFHQRDNTKVNILKIFKDKTINDTCIIYRENNKTFFLLLEE